MVMPLLQNVLKLYSELRDLGADAHGWRAHLAKQLHHIVHSDVTMIVELETERQRPKIIASTEYGWENGFDRQTWIDAMAKFARDPFSHIAFSAFAPRLMSQEVAVATRANLVSDDKWYQSPEYSLLHRIGGFDALAYAACQLTKYSNRRMLLILNRAHGSEQFSDQEMQFVETMMRQIAESVGSSLASIDQPSPSQLPLRRREVLDLLLDGKSDKEIASSLGMAFDTVRGHLKELYQFFRVAGRNELMAKWIGYAQSRGEKSP